MSTSISCARGGAGEAARREGRQVETARGARTRTEAAGGEEGGREAGGKEEGARQERERVGEDEYEEVGFGMMLCASGPIVDSVDDISVSFCRARDLKDYMR